MRRLGVTARLAQQPTGAAAKTPRHYAARPRLGLSRAERVIVFIESLTNTSGIFAGKPFKIVPWQKTFIETVYRTDDKNRRIVRLALLALPPGKPGKIRFCAALALCHFVGPEAEMSGAICSATPDRTQAMPILKEMIAFIRADKALSERIIIKEDARTLKDIATGSLYTALSSDAKKIDSLNVSFGLLDGLKRWRSRDLFDALTAGSAARAEPLFVVFSTKSPHAPAKPPALRLLHLDQPTDPSVRFVSARDWKACRSEVGPIALAGARCILGLDLSTAADSTAAVAFFPETGDMVPWYWMPGDGIAEAERRDDAPYSLWVRQGLIEATSGSAVDRQVLVRRLAKIVTDFDVEICATRGPQADEIATSLIEAGIKLKFEPQGQESHDLSDSLEVFENAILRGELRHPGHAVLDMNVSHALAASDPTGARKLVRDRTTSKIDGLVAAVIAVGAARRAPRKLRSPKLYPPLAGRLDAPDA